MVVVTIIEDSKQPLCRFCIYCTPQHNGDLKNEPSRVNCKKLNNIFYIIDHFEKKLTCNYLKVKNYAMKS